MTSAKNDVDYVLGFMMRNCTIWYGESFDRHKQIKFLLTQLLHLSKKFNNPWVKGWITFVWISKSEYLFTCKWYKWNTNKFIMCLDKQLTNLLLKRRYLGFRSLLVELVIERVYCFKFLRHQICEEERKSECIPTTVIILC